MDLEADETSLGICWAAGSFIPGVGWTLLRGWRLSPPPPVGTRRPGADGRLLTFWVVKQVFQWGPRDMGPLDTLLSDL